MPEDTNASGTQEEEEVNTQDTQKESVKNGSGSQSEVTKDGFTLDGALEEIRKLRSEAANYRVKAKNAEDSRGSLQEQLTEALTAANQWESKAKEIETTLSKLQAEQKTLTLKSQLAGKVIDPDKAIKLIEDKHYNEEGVFQLDKFLEDNPFLAANEQKVNTPANNGGSQPAGDIQKIIEGKDANWIAENWDKLISKRN